tara:strand:- start:331 stop:822 length:492 start_codon:yes stop_codon:yes gene_type:complete
MDISDGKFDPASHRLGQNRWFEDFELGETFRLPSRTMTDALFAAFQLASGDNHPLHYDREYCKRRGYRDLLAHGMQVFIQTAAGAGMFPHIVEESLVAFSEASCRFLAPVFAGDTLYPSLEVVTLLAKKTTGTLVMKATVHNQESILVMEGEHSYIVKKRHFD